MTVSGFEVVLLRGLWNNLLPASLIFVVKINEDEQSHMFTSCTVCFDGSVNVCFGLKLLD